MKGVIARVSAILLLASGCATLDGTSGGEGKTGNTSPVIHRVYASKELPPGDSWKVYLRASDPDGDLKRVIATLGRGDAAGPGFYIGVTRLKAENRKEISGYLYWNSGRSAYIFPGGVLTLQVEDRAGNLSDQASLPLFFRPGAVQTAPPEGVFDEKEIGPIMIFIEPAGGGGGN